MTPCRVLVITKGSFLRLLRYDPFLALSTWMAELGTFPLSAHTAETTRCWDCFLETDANS